MFVRHRVALVSAAVLSALAMSVVPAAAHPAPASVTPVHLAQLAPPAHCGYYGGRATIRRGSSGAAVREVQCIINRWHRGRALAVDGIFGLRTESWVVYFQEKKHLRVDGVVGPQTWAALRAV